jgi:isopentenyldiphosphate isomerase
MSDELFDIVNERDEVIGRATRQEAHARGHIHRSVLFFIFDQSRRVFVNQRTADKEFYPEHWSIVFGGHVHAGETHEEAVRREAAEETGIDAEPFFVASFQKRFDPEDRENVQVYGLVATGEPRIDPSETKQGCFVMIGEIEERLQRDPFLPETTILLQMLRRTQDT